MTPSAIIDTDPAIEALDSSLLEDLRSINASCPIHSANIAHDIHGRTIDYLRISLTDRCNLRCVYCMPEEGVTMMDHCAILTLEEVVRIARVAARSGIKHIRLTGGEPLVRKGICDLIEQIKAIPGIESIALTTNGILLSKMAADLKRAGLDRVNISLDSLHEDQYRAITRRGNLNDALAGIDAALKSGFDPVKINVVVVRHLQQDLLEFARLTIDRSLHVRFIEYMPIGNTRNDLGDLPAIALDKDAAHTAQNDPNLIPWSKDDVVPVSEIKKLINEALEESGKEPLVTLSKEGASDNIQSAPIGWGPATYAKIKGAQGTLGFISAISNHFCAQCNRLRLTSDGKLRPCLFSDAELDIRAALRAEGEAGVERVLQEALLIKPKDHHHKQGTKRGMNKIGG